jgi:hypothetical protein
MERRRDPLVRGFQQEGFNGFEDSFLNSLVQIADKSLVFEEQRDLIRILQRWQPKVLPWRLWDQAFEHRLVFLLDFLSRDYSPRFSEEVLAQINHQHSPNQLTQQLARKYILNENISVPMTYSFQWRENFQLQIEIQRETLHSIRFRDENDRWLHQSMCQEDEMYFISENSVPVRETICAVSKAVESIDRLLGISLPFGRANDHFFAFVVVRFGEFAWNILDGEKLVCVERHCFPIAKVDEIIAQFLLDFAKYTPLIITEEKGINFSNNKMSFDIFQSFPITEVLKHKLKLSGSFTGFSKLTKEVLGYEYPRNALDRCLILWNWLVYAFQVR